MSAYHFSSIFAWSDFFDFRFETIENMLCVFAYQGKDCFLYLPPLGAKVNNSVVRECFLRMGRKSIARIENMMENQLPSFAQHGYNRYHKCDEYVYRNADLKTLAGGGYKAKRHDVNRFHERYPKAGFRPFAPIDLEACGQLYGRWLKNRQLRSTDPIFIQMLEENRSVHQKLMHHANVLGLIGRVVHVDQKIVGYTFGYELNPTTFCVLLEIVDHEYAGLASYIFQRFCNDPAVKSFELINTMDDFGMPNIRQAKEAYHPSQRLAIYNVKETHEHHRP